MFEFGFSAARESLTVVMPLHQQKGAEQRGNDMNTSKLGMILLGMPREALLPILGIIAKNLYGTRLDAFLKEAALAGYQIAEQADKQKGFIEAHRVSSQKMRDAAERRRLRREEEVRRRQEEDERQRQLEAFWKANHPDDRPGNTTTRTGNGPLRPSGNQAGGA